MGYTAGDNPSPKQLRKLLRVFSDGLRKNPDDLLLRLKLAEVLRLLERFDEAISLYSSVAWSYAVAGNLVQSIMLCKLILELNPNHRETQQMLAKLYASKRLREEKQSLPVRKVGDRWVVDPHSGASSPRAGRVTDPTPSAYRPPSLGDIGALTDDSDAAPRPIALGDPAAHLRRANQADKSARRSSQPTAREKHLSPAVTGPSPLPRPHTPQPLPRLNTPSSTSLPRGVAPDEPALRPDGSAPLELPSDAPAPGAREMRPTRPPPNRRGPVARPGRKPVVRVERDGQLNVSQESVDLAADREEKYRATMMKDGPQRGEPSTDIEPPEGQHAPPPRYGASFARAQHGNVHAVGNRAPSAEELPALPPLADRESMPETYVGSVDDYDAGFERMARPRLDPRAAPDRTPESESSPAASSSKLEVGSAPLDETDSAAFAETAIASEAQRPDVTQPTPKVGITGPVQQEHLQQEHLQHLQQEQAARPSAEHAAPSAPAEPPEPAPWDEPERRRDLNESTAIVGRRAAAQAVTGKQRRIARPAAFAGPDADRDDAPGPSTGPVPPQGAPETPSTADVGGSSKRQRRETARMIQIRTGSHSSSVASGTPPTRPIGSEPATFDGLASTPTPGGGRELSGRPARATAPEDVVSVTPSQIEDSTALAPPESTEVRMIDELDDIELIRAAIATPESDLDPVAAAPSERDAKPTEVHPMQIPGAPADGDAEVEDAAIVGDTDDGVAGHESVDFGEPPPIPSTASSPGVSLPGAIGKVPSIESPPKPTKRYATHQSRDQRDDEEVPTDPDPAPPSPLPSSLPLAGEDEDERDDEGTEVEQRDVERTDVDVVEPTPLEGEGEGEGEQTQVDDEPAADAPLVAGAEAAVPVADPAADRVPRATTPMNNAMVSTLLRKDAELAYLEGPKVTECYAAIERQVRAEGQDQDDAELSGEDSANVERHVSDTIREIASASARELQETEPPLMPMLPLFSDLGPSAFVALVERLERRHFAAGEVVLREGEPGDSLMLVAGGKLEVLKADDGRQIKLAELVGGSFFGEFGLLTDQRRHATVRCVAECELLELRKEVLADLIREHPSVAQTLRRFYRQRVLEMVMATSTIFQAVSPAEREPVLSRFTTRRFMGGDVIVEEGASSLSFYVVLIGEVSVTCRDDSGVDVEVGRLTEGDYFGEMSLISGYPAEATVRALRMTEVLVLDTRDFYELASLHPEIWAEVQRASRTRAETNERLLASRNGGGMLV